MKRRTASFFENTIAHVRRQKKIKQVDLAAALEVSPSYLCKIEKGLQEPTEKFMKTSSDFLQVSQAELFPGVRGKGGVKKDHGGPGNRLWTVRQEKGIKQYELARQLECSPSYLSKVEKGLQRPNDRFRKRCAKILRVKESELFAGEL